MPVSNDQPEHRYSPVSAYSPACPAPDNQTIYALPSATYSSVVVVNEENCLKYTFWESSSATIACILSIVYSLHFLLSLPLAGISGIVGFAITFGAFEIWGLAFFLEWLIPLEFACKTTACLWVMFGLRKQGNNRTLITVKRFFQFLSSVY